MRERGNGPDVADRLPVAGRPSHRSAGRGFTASRGAYWASAGETLRDSGAILEEK